MRLPGQRVTWERRNPHSGNLMEDEVGDMEASEKTPGPDCFTKRLLNRSPTLWYNIDILHNGFIHPESKDASIKVLPKPGKDLLMSWVIQTYIPH